jgi:hypothetical protein
MLCVGGCGMAGICIQINDIIGFVVNAIQKCHRLRKPEMSPLRRNGSAASQGGDIRYRSPDWLRGLLALRVFVRNACLTAMAFQEGACRSLYSRYARSQV